VNDITFRIVIALKLRNGWDSEVLDVTTAFLHGDMDEQVFMTMPEGLDLIEDGWDPKEDCAELLQTIYGTKQAGRQYWKKFIAWMKKKGYVSTHVDPCLLMKKFGEYVVIICVYVDDCLITGDRKAIEAAMNDIEGYFETRRLGKLEEYIGCSIIDFESGCILLQPDMITKIEKEFGSLVTEMRDPDSPMGPGITVNRPSENEELLKVEDQKKFRSAVGMLLYLVKHSRPDLSNAVRELSKVMDGATNAHEKLLHRVIKYVLATKNRGVFMNPNEGKIVEAYVDSDYAGDKDTRRSITGYVVYVFGALVAWKSKQQGGVTLSSSEAEYYAISEIATELLFIKQVLQFLEVDFELPITLRVDNNGAIYLANNASSGSRTKHVDVRVHFVRDLTQEEPKVLKIVFVKSADNQADTFTKNTSNEVFWKHTNKYMKDFVNSKREDVET